MIPNIPTTSNVNAITTTTPAKKNVHVNKKRVTPQPRQQQYPQDFCILAEELHCIHCNYDVDWSKDSTLKDHIKSKIHIDRKLNKDGNKGTQQTIDDLTKIKDKKHKVIFDFMQMMMECDIPLEKTDNMRKWLNAYVTNSGFIPSGNTLKRDYVQKMLDKHKSYLISKIKDQNISIATDNTPDRLGRTVMNTIFQLNQGEIFLVDTRFLKATNNYTIFQTVEEVIFEYKVKWLNVDAFVSDSASYNKKTYKTIKSSLNSQTKFMRCWAHLVNGVAGTWENSPMMHHVSLVLSKFHNLMQISAQRKLRFHEFLTERGVDHIKHIPAVVHARWGTWYKGVIWLNEFIDHVSEFLRLESQTQDESALFESILEIIDSKSDCAELKFMVSFTAQYADLFFQSITFFEAADDITHLAHRQIMNLWMVLRMNINRDDFGEELTDIMIKNDMNKSWWIKQLQNLYQRAFDKLDTHIKQYDSFKFLEAVRILDPNQVAALIPHHIDLYTSELFWDKADNNLMKEFRIYLGSKITVPENTKLVKFWSTLIPHFPKLSKLAIRCLGIPVNSVSVERSFSMYRKLLESRRCNLGESSIETISMLNFNANFNDELSTLDMNF